jgi:hypothetical protein
MELAPDLLRAGFQGLRFLLNRIRLERCAVSGRLEASDPAGTGALYGVFQAVAGIAGVWLSKCQVNVLPGFDGTGTILWIDAEASVRVLTLVLFPLVLFLNLPKKALLKLAIETVRR